MAPRSSGLARARATFGAAVCLLFLGAWTWIPAPTYTFLTLSVGAPELSPWLALLSAIALVVAALDAKRVMLSRAAAVVASLALIAPLSVLLRLPSTLRAFDAMLPPASVKPAVSIRALFLGLSVDGIRSVERVDVPGPGGSPLDMLVHRPRRDGPFPIVLQVYGGAWQRGGPDDDSQLADALAAAGYVVCAVDYRHAPQWQWPAPLDDVRAAIAWVRAHASAIGGDASRIAMLGRSSGSELAFVAGVNYGSGSVRALVLNYSPVDLADGYRHPGTPDTLHLQKIERDLFGGSVDERPDAYRDASPITYADRPHPPVLMISGGRDHIVYPSYSETLLAHLATSGDARLLLIPWADHAFDAVPFGPSAQIEITYTQRFLAQVFAR